MASSTRSSDTEMINPASASASTSAVPVEDSFPVLLNIYDAIPFILNAPLHVLGLGLYRSAVEVHGEEYIFCPVQESPPGSMILTINPSRRKRLTLRESIVVGRTHMKQDQVRAHIQALRNTAFGNSSYNAITKNSHHFSDEVRRLIIDDGAVAVPLWLKRWESIEPRIEWLTVRARSIPPFCDNTYPVVLNIYDVDPSNVERRCDLRFYRTSVEVHGVEYMFCEDRGMSGVATATPGYCPGFKGLTRRQSIVVGRTQRMTKADVESAVNYVGHEHVYGKRQENTYDYYSKNCHHFADHLCVVLTGKHIPCCLRRAAVTEKFLTGEALTKEEEERRRAPLPRQPLPKAALPWWKTLLLCFCPN